ncbi:hypothetical protein BJ875DRAFT_372907 [Amylocarpus encephaloides]|uniref:C2H2-type domain-containing protein n=1 Tax=Amylocarpus encephaloides TaxID=45428 RepID=A0A9P8C6W8_9HELO|nr:hypothetical protein BJ875DRAFT_372907 [Amylocarpus encephaloides]
MSFLSKRSRSQIPYKPGSEEISVRRLEGSGAIAQCRTDSFHSDSSSPPNATDFALYDSCVLRKFPKHKSSHLRFLAWVAYTRKFTDDPITEDERRTCPLLIFSKLGSKRHRTQPAPEPEPDMSIAKYSETAKTLENHPDFSNTCDAGPVESFDTTEMTSAGLLEGSSSWPRISQELPDTQICEMTGSDCPLELSTGPENWMTQGFPACPERWFSPNASAKNVEHPKSRGSLDMLPPLNTQLGQGNLGRNPTAIVQSFAFTHVAYAFTIAMDHDEIKVHTQEWFRDSLSWVDGLGSERERARYSKIAQAIWKPVESLSEGPLPRLFSVSPENRLYLVCKRFLDVLESFGSSDVKISTDSVPNVTPTTFPKRAQAQVIDELIKTVSIEAFIEDVVKVEKRLNRGHIKSVRELELELMCAGKLAYNRFLAHVTHRCNSLYGSSPTRSRAEHHIRDIALVKILLPEESFSDQGQEEERNFELELEDDLPLGFQLDTLGRCDKRLGDSLNEFIRDADNSLKSHCCNLCDYIPMGEEKWKASNIRRHKRTQHASKGSYLCKWPGCAKIFTRSDNLRSHMKAQGHGLGAGITKGGEGEEDDEEDDADVVGATRGSEGRWNEREDGERAPKRVRMVGE